LTTIRKAKFRFLTEAGTCLAANRLRLFRGVTHLTLDNDQRAMLKRTPFSDPEIRSCGA